jgi:hypothetical protein
VDEKKKPKSDPRYGRLEKFYWNDLPHIRISTLREDGSLSDYTSIPAKHFGGTIPSVGDVVGVVWGNKDYDFQVVQQRYFIQEFRGENYWLLVVNSNSRSARFDAVSTNVLLATDLERAILAKRPEKEIRARMADLSEKRPANAKRFRPKVREPHELGEID